MVSRANDLDLEDFMGKPFMSSDDFALPSGKYRTVTMAIRGVEQEMLPGEVKPKIVLYFTKTDGQDHLKGLVLNATNYRTIKAEYGSKRSKLIGQPLVLFCVDTQMPDGTPTKGIRVRVPESEEGFDPNLGKDEAF